MKLFGYSEKKLSRAGLLSLREVSFEATADELAALASFLSDTAAKMKQGAFRTDHAHFPAPSSEPQVIVLNPDSASIEVRKVSTGDEKRGKA